MLDQCDAVTVSEMEARGSDENWNPRIWPKPIDPHHFTNARHALLQSGDIEFTTAQTRSREEPVTTWSLAATTGRRRRILDTAARKRLLTARHSGWARRGGAGRGLIGSAGEAATHTAMTHSKSAVANVTGPVREVLGVPLLGEIDNSGVYVTPDDDQLVPVLILVEVKNKRTWLYPDSEDVTAFLFKAAHLQHHRPQQLILPLIVARKVHYTLWQQGVESGFLPSRVENQLVLGDHELDATVMGEVRAELGYSDLRLGASPTNRHIGIFEKAIPRYALNRARLWRDAHPDFLAEPI